MFRTHNLITLALLTFVIVPGIASAQVVPPSSTQPGQVQQRLQIEPERPEINTQPLMVVPEDMQKPSAAVAGVMFVLKKIVFEDLGAFKEEDLRNEYSGYIDKKVSLATLQQIAGNITLRYRDAGYILSRAVLPPQQITEKDGIVRIKIVEGYINKVIIEGNKSKSKLLDEYADKIRNAKPLNEKTLERYFLLMQDLPGVSVRSTLRPAEGAPGASDVIITVSETPVDGNVSLDNRGTRYMGPIEAGLTANANNMLGFYDRTQFRGVETAEANQLRYGQIAHEEQLDSEGTKLTLSASYTRTHPVYTLEQLDMQGSDELYSVNVTHPFIRSRQSNLYGNIQFDVHDTTMDSLDTQLYDDRLRILRMGGSYDFSDSFSAINRIEGTLSQGLSWSVGSSDMLSRDNGQTNFLKANMQVSREQPIPVLKDVSVYIAGTGQMSANTLLIDEQFGIGGTGFGSAYDPSEITGDSGVAGRAELRYNRFGDIAFIPSYQIYGFYDIGKVWSRDTASPQASNSLADAGFGLRFNASKPLSGSLEFAAPLTRVVAADGQDDGYRPRVFFSLNYRF